MRFVFFLVAFLVSYGSLYPFGFDLEAGRPDAFAALWDTLGEVTERGDVLANIALFLPYGFAGWLACSGASPVARIVIVVGSSLVIGTGLQIAQIYVPARHAHLQDAVWNVLGTVVGMGFAAATRLPSHCAMSLAGRWSAVPAVLVGAWLGYRWMPFVPTLDIQQLKNSLKPLLLTPDLTTLGAVHNCVAWSAFALLWSKVAPGVARERNLWLVVPGIMAVEVLMRNNAISASNVLGAALGLTAWFAWLRRSRVAAVVVASAIMAVLLMRGLEPFALREVQGTFHWVPFRGFLSGSLQHNTTVLFEKVFLYGTFLWVVRDVSGRWTGGAVMLVVVTGFIEAAQVAVRGHVAEITDPVLAVLLAITLKQIERAGADRPPCLRRLG